MLNPNAFCTRAVSADVVSLNQVIARASRRLNGDTRAAAGSAGNDVAQGDGIAAHRVVAGTQVDANRVGKGVVAGHVRADKIPNN